MKLQVGRTYKDGRGNQWYIEHRFSRQVNSLPIGTFMGINLGRNSGWNGYSEDGTLAGGYPGDKLDNLVPTVAKIYSFMFRGIDASQWVASATVFDSETERDAELARRRVNNRHLAYAPTTIEYEEDA